MPSVVIDCLSGKRRFIKDGISLVDHTGLAPVFLPDEYDHAWPFSEGLAAVEVDGKIGFVDSNGTMAIEPRYESRYKVSKDIDKKALNIYRKGKYPPIFSGGIAPVYEEDGVVWINSQGDVVRHDFEQENSTRSRSNIYRDSR